MQEFDESKIEYADFVFDREKVACYGMINNAGGSTTVLNFPSMGLADEFRSAFLANRSFPFVQNRAQLVCMADYDTVMRRSDNDPRVRCLNYNRSFMLGTLDHIE